MKHQMRAIWVTWMVCWLGVLYTCQLRCEELPPGLYTIPAGATLQIMPTEPPVPPSYPEPMIDYKPQLGGPGSYSVHGACADLHAEDAYSVTLGVGEKLESALARLGTLGGVVNIPYGAPLQCDGARIGPGGGPVTLRGTPGSGGKLPRFYCRSDEIGGTIPNREVRGIWLEVLDGDTSLLVENLHVDGYKKQVRMPTFGHFILRNNYLHHATQDAINNANSGGSERDAYKGIDGPGRFHLEMCGNEIAHSGQGNFKHNTYMHRSLGGIGDHPELDVGGPGLHDTWTKVTYVDNLCHSPRWSSCFKSIANENVVIGNRFYTRLETDPSYDMAGMSAQMLIDVANCSQNIIRGNALYAWKDGERGNEGGSAAIGIRGRKTAMRGCDTPMMWHPYENHAQPTAIEGPAHTEAFWSALGGRIFFKTVIEDNYIEVVGRYANRLMGLEVTGTYPAYDVRNRRCELPTPMNWYERSRTYVSNNTWVGFDPAKVYVANPGSHNYQHCHGYEDTRPPGPGPSDALIEVGAGEIVWQ